MLQFGRSSCLLQTPRNAAPIFNLDLGVPQKPRIRRPVTGPRSRPPLVILYAPSEITSALGPMDLLNSVAVLRVWRATELQFKRKTISGAVRGRPRAPELRCCNSVAILACSRAPEMQVPYSVSIWVCRRRPEFADQPRVRGLPPWCPFSMPFRNHLCVGPPLEL